MTPDLRAVVAAALKQEMVQTLPEYEEWTISCDWDFPTANVACVMVSSSGLHRIEGKIHVLLVRDPTALARFAKLMADQA